MDTATAKNGAVDDNPSASPMAGVEDSADTDSEERKSSPTTTLAEEDGEDEPKALGPADVDANADADDDAKVDGEDNVSSEDSEEESSSSEDESSSDDEDEDEDDDDNTGDDGQSSSGLSEYELLRLKRIERNKARLAELGLAGGSIAKKSGHGKKKVKTKEKTEEDLVASRVQPKRAKKSALTQEQLHGPSIARYTQKDRQPKAPRTPKKEKYVPGTCFGCKKEDDEQRIYCAYCRYQYHPQCHEPEVVLPLAEGTLFRCGNCEGKSKRLACGFCEPCNRTEDCGGCTYCIEKTQSGARKKKCIYRRCLVMFNIQPHVPGTKPLTLQVGEGPKKSKKDEANDKEGRDTSSAPSMSAATLSAAGNDIQVDDETEESIEIATKGQTAMDVSHHEDRCFACKDGGVLICCDDCDRVWHPACHRPMVLNVYSKLHCMECKREEREAAIELIRKQEKERRNQRRLASGALAGIVDGELVFVGVVGPSPCCAICGIQRHKFKPIPLPPAKRVLYASIDLPEEERSGSSDDESLDDKSDDSGAPLTTNVPKDVEVLNARSMRKVIKTFSSCSEAARAMSVNRTKLSRLCRKGGGVIGVYHFRYASADDEGGMEDVTSTSRKRKRKKKKKKANRPQQKIIECVVKWPRESFEEATAKKNAATAAVSATAIATVSATGTGSSQTSLNCPKPIAPAQNEGVAPSATTSTPHPSSISNRNDGNAPQSTAQAQRVASSAPTSVSLPSNTANNDGGNAPQQSGKRTATGKPACSYGECLKQSQGRRYNYMCLVHFKQTTPGNSTDLTAITDVEQVAPPQTSSSNLSSEAKLTDAGSTSTAFTFPGSGIPQQSDRLTKTGAIACAYGNCPKQSQGRRLNFMCMSHFRSITGGKMIEVLSGGDGAASEDTSSWTCDNCGLVVPGSLSRCKCYRWRNGVHPMSKKKKNLKTAEAQNSSSAVTSKASIGTSKAGDDEEDTTDWDCDNCGRKVPGKLSRCKCYRWRNGIHPMSKKKSKLKQDSASISNQKHPGSLDGGAQKVAGGSNRKATESRESSVATNTSVDASKTDEVTPSNATDEKPKTEEEAPSASQIEAAEPVDKTVGSKEVDEMEFAYEPILDATVYDSDGDDVPIRVTVKWPHENPDARRSDDMIYCNTCGAWYHLHCVSPPILHRDKGGPRRSYKCQTCISTGRNRMYNAVTSSKKSTSSVAMSLPATAASSGTTRLAPDGAGTNSSTASRTRKMKCGQCDACRRPDCGECANCRDKKKFGGPHRHRQRCILKTCTNPQHRPLFSLTSSRSGIVAQAPSTTSAPAPTFASQVDPLNKADKTESSVPAASTALTGEVVVNTDILVFDEIDGRESHRYEMQLSGGKMRRVMKCRVENCNKNSRGKKFDGFCLSHFNETYPNVAIMGSMTVKLCKVLGCSRNSRGSGNKYNGMCCHHHNESLRGVVHEIKETNERVPRPKKVGKPISAKINLEPTESVGQGTGKSSLGGSEMISEASEEISGDDIINKETTAEPMKKRQLELPKDLGDDTPQGEPQAKKKRGGKVEEEEEEEEDGNHDPTHVNMQSEDDGDLCVEPKPKKARITISVGQEEKEKSSSLSRNGKTKPEKAKKPNTNATPAPPNKKRASLDKRNEKDLDPTSKKILKIIRTAEKYPGDAKKQDQVCEALRKHANDLDAASKMIKLGGLDIIAAAMKMHEGVPMVQAEAIGTIADLVWIDAEHGGRVAELGFIDLIASAMELHGTHPKINKLGCGFFRTCSYDKVNADRVKKIGMVAVTAAMKRNPRKCDVLKEGSVFLQNMLVVYPDLARAVIKRQRGEVEDNGIVPILVDALKNNGKDAKLHEAVCGVLSNVALIESGKSAIIKAGVIPVLMRVLKNASVISGEIALKRTLLSFLTLLATDDKANIQTMLPDLRDGGLEDTLSIIKQHPKDSPLLVAAFEFLKAIAEHNEEAADEMARSGAVKLIVSAMQKHAGFDQIQIASCALLSVVKHNGSKTSTSAAKRVIDAIETHEDDPNVLEEACHALYNLATCASNVVPLIKSKDVRETLTKIKEGHPEEIGEIVDEVLRISSLRSARRT